MTAPSAPGRARPSSPSVVRIATPFDRDECWRLFLQGHQENGLFALAPEKVDYLLYRCLFAAAIPPTDPGPRGVIGVIGRPGALEAMALLIIAEYWYTADKHLEEMLVYVDPDHRKSHHARALIGWMKAQAEVTGIPLLTGVVSHKRTQAKCALYGRMLPKVGEFFLYFGSKGNSAAATRH